MNETDSYVSRYGARAAFGLRRLAASFRVEGRSKRMPAISAKWMSVNKRKREQAPALQTLREARARTRVLCLTLAATVLIVVTSAGRAGTQVVAYCAQDQVYAEPIFREFQKETGIRVLAVYDNEAVKTVGLANRLIAERHHPVCDVFWGNEEMRTRQLAAQDIFRETNGWARFGYRSRRLVINTNLISIGSAARSLLDLTNSEWHARFAVAYPQFGTTAAHFHSLRQHWGDAFWQSWCRALAANEPLMVDGNSEVVKAVARGQAQIGLTDSDDIADGQREGLPVAALPMNDETLLIPNTVAVIRGAPHPAAAEKLFEYLQTRRTLEELVKAHAIEGLSATEMGLRVDWGRVLRDLEQTTSELNRVFLR